VRYNPIGKRAGNGALVVGESEDKIEEARNNSLEEEIVKRKAVKRKAMKKEAVM